MGHGILPLDLSIIADSIRLPEGYTLISAQYDDFARKVNFLVESGELAETPEGTQLPRLSLIARVDPCPECRKITTWIEKSSI